LIPLQATPEFEHTDVAVLIEQKMAEDLLHLACRHHIFEVVLGDVFNDLAGPSTEPEILMFKRFQNAWPSIIHDMIADGLSYDESTLVLNDNKETMQDALEFGVECRQKVSEPLGTCTDLHGSCPTSRVVVYSLWCHAYGHVDGQGCLLFQSIPLSISIPNDLPEK
jgi:hypothetical protein